MIDIENYIINSLSTGLQSVQGVFVKSEYVKNITQFPCVLISEKTNNVYQKTSDETIENHAKLMYQIDIFSNLETGKKTQCKQIASMVDDIMSNMGFTRIMLEPIENIEDATIYRMVARYEAISSKSIDGINYIYRN
jgi:phenylalanyl-tRNA synthetase alpha subunit